MRLVPPKGKVKALLASPFSPNDHSIIAQSKSITQKLVDVGNATFMLIITVNDFPRIVHDSTNVLMLLIELCADVSGVAVAVNNHVIAKKDWEGQLLNNSDDVLIITATQGG